MVEFNSVAAVFTTACAGFMNTNGRELWEQRLQLIPNPFCQDFAGWIFKTRNVVQIVVIEALIEWLEDRFDFGKITNPAGMRIDFSRQIDGHTK